MKEKSVMEVILAVLVVLHMVLMQEAFPVMLIAI
jgi:hypothetical protein